MKTLEQVKLDYIQIVLKLTQGRQDRAADILGISYSGLQWIMRKQGWTGTQFGFDPICRIRKSKKKKPFSAKPIITTSVTHDHNNDVTVLVAGTNGMLRGKTR